jgi:hypothetical protein
MSADVDACLAALPRPDALLAKLAATRRAEAAAKTR